MLYHVDILYCDGTVEYLLGEWENTTTCLEELRQYREYDNIDQLIIKEA